MSLLASAAHATSSEASAEPLDAIWREHRLNFEYQSFNVHYSCSGLQAKVGAILVALGARRDIDVAVSCASDALVASASLLVTLWLPIVASEQNVRIATTYSAQQELLARLQRVQLPTANDIERFPAEWRTVALTRIRRLNLESGDCDLMAGVRDQLLPKLGLSVAGKGLRCSGGGTRLRPSFEVVALVAMAPATVALSPQPQASPASTSSVAPERVPSDTPIVD